MKKINKEDYRFWILALAENTYRVAIYKERTTKVSTVIIYDHEKNEIVENNPLRTTKDNKKLAPLIEEIMIEGNYERYKTPS